MSETRREGLEAGIGLIRPDQFFSPGDGDEGPACCLGCLVLPEGA